MPKQWRIFCKSISLTQMVVVSRLKLLTSNLVPVCLQREQNTGDYNEIFTTGFVRQIVEYHISFCDHYFEKQVAWQYAQQYSVSWQGENNRRKANEEQEEAVTGNQIESETENKVQILTVKTTSHQNE